MPTKNSNKRKRSTFAKQKGRKSPLTGRFMNKCGCKSCQDSRNRF